MKRLRTTFFEDLVITDEPIDNIIFVINKKILPNPSYIVTPNADHFYRLHKKECALFVQAYEHADLRICDSRIVQKLSILEDKKICNIVPGSDLTQRILKSDWAKNTRMLLVGSTAIEAEVIKAKYALCYFEHYAPPMGFINSELEIQKCINVITTSKASIVFLAVGSPQQEILANRIKNLMNVVWKRHCTLLCIGASFDFLSGRLKRAPLIIQKLHLEWLHRALSNPTRLIPRYWKNSMWIISYIFGRLFFKLSRVFKSVC